MQGDEHIGMWRGEEGVEEKGGHGRRVEEGTGVEVWGGENYVHQTEVTMEVGGRHMLVVVVLTSLQLTMSPPPHPHHTPTGAEGEGGA